MNTMNVIGLDQKFSYDKCILERVFEHTWKVIDLCITHQVVNPPSQMHLKLEDNLGIFINSAWQAQEAL